MITIDIWIMDKEAYEREETLGIKSDVEKDSLTKLYLKESSISGFWVDFEPKGNSSHDIIFYACGSSFRTPWTKEKEDMFINLLM